MSRKHMGSSIDDFLKEEGIFEEAQARAVHLRILGRCDRTTSCVVRET
jgi:hypothetical protein